VVAGGPEVAGVIGRYAGLWTTEFGWMPTHGRNDDFGRRVVSDVTTVHDYWATVLHLLGLNHERLAWYHNGINRRLTDVHGHVIRELLS
jgi:hypothetical protein